MCWSKFRSPSYYTHSNRFGAHKNWAEYFWSRMNIYSMATGWIYRCARVFRVFLCYFFIQTRKQYQGNYYGHSMNKEEDKHWYIILVLKFQRFVDIHPTQTEVQYRCSGMQFILQVHFLLVAVYQSRGCMDIHHWRFWMEIHHCPQMGEGWISIQIWAYRALMLF